RLGHIAIETFSAVAIQSRQVHFRRNIVLLGSLPVPVRGLFVVAGRDVAVVFVGARLRILLAHGHLGRSVAGIGLNQLRWVNARSWVRARARRLGSGRKQNA